MTQALVALLNEERRHNDRIRRATRHRRLPARTILSERAEGLQCLGLQCLGLQLPFADFLHDELVEAWLQCSLDQRELLFPHGLKLSDCGLFYLLFFALPLNLTITAYAVHHGITVDAVTKSAQSHGFFLDN